MFLCILKEQKECVALDPYTFVALIDKIVVEQNGKRVFCFRNGMEIGNRNMRKKVAAIQEFSCKLFASYSPVVV